MIQIKNRWDDSVIFTSEESTTFLHAVERAVRERVILDNARLDNARLDNARLDNARLVGARLDPIRNDFWDVLIHVRHEIPELRKALVEGRIDGSVYEGECACLVGTIANIKHCKYKEIENLQPNSSRPIECFFMGIKKGDKPEKNQISKIAIGWIDEFLSFESTKMKKNPHAVALGKKGGKAKSRAKITSSKANGKFGGRPKKTRENCEIRKKRHSSLRTE